LPDAPPEPTECDCNKCESCENTANWWEILKNTVDDLILRSNVHNVAFQFRLMRKNKRKNEEVASTSMEIVKHDSPDKHLKRLRLNPKTGALNIKKGEKWINTLTPIVTFLQDATQILPVCYLELQSRLLLLTYQTMSQNLV